MPPTEPSEPIDPAIADKIASFRGDLARFNVDQFVQRHITFGTCHVLDDDRYFDIKLRIADNFRIHPSAVIVVGSSKLGFSIADSKRYRPFGDTSDIDVAIVSAPLFDNYWKAVFDYKTQRNFWEKESNFSLPW